MMLIGMAVAVDYSLFYLKREREERARGAGKLAALEAAAATSGHAVLVSGLTVMVSLAGMFFMGDARRRRDGDRLDPRRRRRRARLADGAARPCSRSSATACTRSRLPLLRRLKREERDSRVWGFVLGHVMRRPVVALVGRHRACSWCSHCPAIGMHTKQTGLDDISRSAFPVLKTYDHIQQSFPGERSAAEVVVQAADVTRPACRPASPTSSARRSLPARCSARSPRPRSAATARSPASTCRSSATAPNGASMDALTQQCASSCRQRSDPSPGTTVDVGGDAAATKDGNDNLATHAPLVFGFVLAMAFLLLLVTFRSIVIPIKAILLNLLSVAAAFGVLTLVFQHGWGEFIGMPHTTGIASWLPVFLFVILFGLSMDYHVFILSRIKEGWDRASATTPPSSRASAARPAS